MKKLSDQIRDAVDQSGMSRFVVANYAEIEQSQFSRFMSGTKGRSLDAIDRLAAVIGIRIIQQPNLKIAPPRRRKKGSTEIGYKNPRGQTVIRRLDRSQTHGNQFCYELECKHCGHRYGAAGCDILGASAGAGRSCPNCQGGAAGESIT